MIPFTVDEVASLVKAGWRDGGNSNSLDMAYYKFWGLGGIACDCCQFGGDCILTKLEQDDGITLIVGTPFDRTSNQTPWASVSTVEEALEAFKTAD